MNLSRKFQWLVGAFFLLAFAIYVRSLGNDFVNWDDYLLILDNPFAHGVTLGNIVEAFTSFDPELYVPLTFLSFQVDWMLGWGSPLPFHLTNLLLHTLNALLVTLFVFLLLRKSVAIPIVAGLLFLAHPFNTEAVAWASARKDLLSAMFMLVSLCAFEKYAEDNRISRAWYVASVAAFLLGLLAKVSVITLPVILVLLDWRSHRRIGLRALRDLAPFLLLSVVFGFIALLGKPSGTEFLWVKLLVACKATLFYLGKMFWPTGLSVLYPYTAPISLLTPDLYWSFVGIIALTLIAAASLFRTREVFFAWMFYLLALLPSFANVLKSGGAQLDVYFASDRYAYVPMVAVLFLAGSGVGVLSRRFPTPGGGGLHAMMMAIAIGFTGVIVAVFSVLSYHQSLVWKDTASLFTHVLEHYPNAQVAHNNIGALLYRSGKYDAAIAEFRQSLSIRPTETAFFNLGRAYMEKGMEAEAIEAYQASLVINPNYSDTLINYGVYLMDHGELESAAELFERAAAAHEEATMVTALFNLGLVYQKQGRNTEALAAFRKVLERDPTDREALEWVEELEVE